jgi:hypothetical protein
MPFDISGLANNIAKSLDNLVNSLTGTSNPGQLYPKDSTTEAALNPVTPGNWLKLPFPYSFCVYDIVTGDLGPGFTEFQLPLAPGKISQTEHFATSIKPTQGGTVVSHAPSKYKTLVIGGTTGLAPFRGAGGVEKSTGMAIFQPAEMKYKSGYEVFHELRNYFKAYYEYKANVKDSKNLRLVWKNYKDGEFLIIEIIDFQMDRQAQRSFLYDYNIQCKVLGQLRFGEDKEASGKLAEFEKKLKRATQLIDNARGIFLRSQDILRQIESTYDSSILEPLRKANLAIKAFQGIGTTANDMGNRIIRKTITAAAALGILIKIEDLKKFAAITGGSDILDRTVLPSDLRSASKLNPADSVIGLNEGLSLLNPEDFPETTRDELTLEVANVQTLPRNFYENTLLELNRVKNNAEDFFGLGSSTYDTLFNRTSTVTADPAKAITDEEFDVLDGFNQAIQAIQFVLASDTLFKSSFNDRIKTIITSFDGQIQLKSLPAVEQITMPQGVDLERLAQDYLGDSSRWVEIAELNDLRAPFVIQDMSDTTTNVVRPGNVLLIPAPPQNGFTKLPNGKEITSGPSLSELEMSLGSDLKLTSDFDLAMGNNGDLQIIRGTDNVAQAVVLKLGYERGELMGSPGIGVGLGIGKKFPPLSQIKEDLIRSLTQDPRIEKIENLRVEQNGPELRLSFELKIKQIDIPVPVTIKV